MYPPGRSATSVEYADIAAAALHAAKHATTVFHLHWEDAVYRALAPDRQPAAIERFVAQIEQFKQFGGTFVWTMHNVLPHDGVDLVRALAFNRRIANLADLVHVHSQAAAQEARRTYGLEADRIRVIEHPSYDGVYPAASEFTDTRQGYGIPDSDFVLLCLGAIRPYKNIDALLEAVEDLPDRCRVVIAGAPGRHSVPVGSPRSVVIDRRVSEQEVSDLFGMADFAVISAESATTSGTAMLALTMGVPVILPMRADFAELVSDGREGFLFLPERRGDLRRVIDAAMELPPWRYAAMRAAARATAAFYSPDAFAERIDHMIKEAFELTLAKKRRTEGSTGQRENNIQQTNSLFETARQ